jgi:HAE1 family hydrophobic/amphiphilic exporter-1
MRGFIALSVRRPVTVVMITVAILVFGWVSYNRLSLELFPDIAYPSLTIQTEFPDTAPQEVENLITRPVEEAVGVLRGLTGIHSVSRAGVSEVTLAFDWGSDMELLALDVREKLDRIILPAEAKDPLILRFDPSLEPIMRLAFTGSDDLTALRRVAERQLKQDFETVPGIASAQIKGGLQEEIQVSVDQERLAALGIPLDRVRATVGGGNLNLPGGVLRGRDSQFLIRTVNEYDSVEEIADLIIQDVAGRQVRVGDVAKVYWGTKEREEITRVNGREAVEIAIFKEGDANTVTAARALKARLEEWRGGKLPVGDDLTVLFDQSRFIANAVKEVRDAAIFGGLLAIAVLFLFLREWRSTLIIGTSIPVSVIATFVLMYRLDISLNLMSLGGLTLGIGMLVDNSIVVLEAIHRRRQLGQDPALAAVGGTDEVGAAVMASTLTTVAVFLPIVFVEGIAGQLFGDQALTVTFSLMTSLIVAVSLIPMLAAAGGDRRLVAAGRRDDQDFDDDDVRSVLTLGRFSRWYDGVVRGALARPGTVLLLAAGLLGLSAWGLLSVGTELIPPLSEGEFFFEVMMPEGTSLAATDAVMVRGEKAAAADSVFERNYATVGSRLPAGGVSVNTKAENLAQINLVMRDRGDEVVEAAAAERLRQTFLQIPDVEAKFGRPGYFSLKTPVEIQIFGEDLEMLRAYSLDLVGVLAQVPGLVDVRSSLEAGNPELRVVFDRRRLAALNLDMTTLSETLRDRVQGVVPTRFKEEDRQIDIRIRNREADRASLADVRNLVIPGADGRPLRLLSVADVTLARGPAEIHRLQQQRAAIVTANLTGRSLGAAVADVEVALAATPPPAGLSVELGGQNEEMKVSFASLRFALALAIFLVYLVMAATFESFVHPFIVMFTIPLALVGIAAGLLATGTEISVIVLIGAVMLVGIVVNNAIILIDAVNRFRRLGMDKREAIVRAGHVRLRPILMTTLTTVLGLVPMALAFGEGAELRAPLAITVASGLTFSTLLTLVVIPAVYLVVPSKVQPLIRERVLQAVKR